MKRHCTHSELWLLAACAALAAGEALGFALSRFCALCPVAAALAVFSALFGYALSVRFWPHVAVFLAGLALSLASAEARADFFRRADILSAGRPFETEVVVTGGATARTSADGAEWVSFGGVAGPVRLRVVGRREAGAPLPVRGERWECAGWLSRDGQGRGRPRILWAKGAGTYARRAPPSGRDRLARLALRVRRSLSRRLGLGLADGAESAALCRAILLGERAALDGGLKDEFAAAGTVHVFAISGLHVMVVAEVMLVALSLLCVPRRAAGIALVPMLWAYVFVVGAPPSAVRAALMATFYFAGPLFWRRGDTLSAWALAFLAVHAADPSMLADVGCRLSFAVMLALAAWSRLCDGIGGAAGASAVAWAAGAPLAAQAFGRLTAGSLAANLALLPLAAVCVGAGALGCMASVVSDSLAAHFNNAAALAARFMAELSRMVASVPGASVSVERWSWADCALWYAALALAVATLWAVRRFFKRL